MIEQLVHDLPQPLRLQYGGQFHRTNHVGEQDGDLLVLRCLAAVCQSRAALATEVGSRTGLRAAGAADQCRRGQSTATVPAMVHVSIVSPLVSDVIHIVEPSPSRSLETLAGKRTHNPLVAA